MCCTTVTYVVKVRCWTNVDMATIVSCHQRVVFGNVKPSSLYRKGEEYRGGDEG